MKSFKKIVEDLSMSIGAGMSTASSTQGNPIAGYDTIMSKSPIRRKPQRFGGKAVFSVDSDTYQKALLGKQKFKHYKTYVGRGDIGEEIRQYAMNNRDEPIILQNEMTGEMVFLKYGSK